MITQRQEKYPSISLKVTNNISKLVTRGYIKEVVILAQTSLFSVPKGTADIRMVFDAIISGLKDSLWAPKFMLPSMSILLMMVGPEMHMFDLDVGKMFYEFRLLSVLANLCGVDLGYFMGYKKDWQGTSLWMIWVSLIMGLVLYPYAAIQVLLW